MGSEYTFYDYIDAGGDGVNVINHWLNGEGKPAKAYFNHMIAALEASPPPGLQDSVWREPYVKQLVNKNHRNWGGFIEIRKTGRVQYRLIAKILERRVFLIAHGIHKGRNFETDISPETALVRVDRMTVNPGRYSKEHEYK